MTYPAVNWLGKSRGMVSDFVLPQYERQLLGYLSRRERYLLLFHLVAVLLTGSLVLGAAMRSVELMGGSLLGLAILFAVFPFASEGTLQIMGAAKSITVARAGAAILAMLGLALLILSGQHGGTVR